MSEISKQEKPVYFGGFVQRPSDETENRLGPEQAKPGDVMGRPNGDASGAHAASADGQAMMRTSGHQRPEFEDALLQAERKLREANEEAEFHPTLDQLQCRNTALEQRLALQHSITERLECDKATLEENLIFLRERNQSLLLSLDRLQAIEASTIWRATSQLRAVADPLPPPVRRYPRR